MAHVNYHIGLWNRKSLFLLALWFGSILCGNSASVSFNNYVSPQNNDLANNFYVFSAGGGVLSQTPSGGITGGALQFGPTNNLRYAEAVYWPSIFRNNANDSFQASGFFRISDDPLFHAILGFSSRPDSSQMGLGATLGNGGAFTLFYSPEGMALTSRSFLSGRATPPLALGLSTNNWYRFSLSVLHNQATSDFTLTGTVEDYGISGTSLVSLLGSNSFTVVNAAMLDAPTVWGGVAGESGSLNYAVMKFDNFQANGFEIVPEPSALGLVSIGFCIATFLHIRKRSNATS